MIAASSVITPALVYVRTNGRVSPQVWHEPSTDIAGFYRGRIVAATKISPALAHLPFDVLTNTIPPPAVTEDVS